MSSNYSKSSLKLLTRFELLGARQGPGAGGVLGGGRGGHLRRRGPRLLPHSVRWAACPAASLPRGRGRLGGAGVVRPEEGTGRQGLPG